MNDISLQNLKKCYEMYRKSLLEAKFTLDNGKRHYQDHVYDVGPDLEYEEGQFQGDHAGPYYEYMTFKEYCDRAEELSLWKAGLWDSNDTVVGCTIYDDKNGLRLVKIRNTMESIKDHDYLDFEDVVIYVDSSLEKVGGKNTGDVIITYMPVKASKCWDRYDKQKVCELPENLPDSPVDEDLIQEEFLDLIR